MDLVGEIERSGQGADDALRAWGRANRFAGSKDRARIGETLYAVFRRRGECAFRMGTDSPRALVLAACLLERGMGFDDLEACCDGLGHNPAPLTQAERRALEYGPDAEAPPAVRLNLPDWMAARFDPRFDPEKGLPAFDARAPLDLRVNTLKVERAAMVGALKDALGPDGPPVTPCPISPWGLRVAARGPTRQAHAAGKETQKRPDLRTLEAYRRGLVEIQDEGSQLAAALSGAAPDAIVIDLCAGAGGKTLALGAMMHDRGRLLACDTAAHRLARAQERIDRAGLSIAACRPITPWQPDGTGAADPDLAPLAEAADLVFVDAPCSGSGTWRRRPEARWQLTPEALGDLQAIQTGILERAVRLVRPGGRLVYVTCSLFEAENTAVTARVFSGRRDFEPVPARGLWAQAGLPPSACPGSARPVSGQPEPAALGGDDGSLLLAPHISGTDGFFLAAFRRLP